MSLHRGRWRSSWWEPSTVKCSAMRLRSVIFMPSNWLSRAALWRKELVCGLLHLGEGLPQICGNAFLQLISWFYLVSPQLYRTIKHCVNAENSLRILWWPDICFSGYLAVSLFLNESHELLLLLVNTVLKVDARFLQHLFLSVWKGDVNVFWFFFFSGSPEHKPNWGVHGSYCRQSDFPQRYDSCNPSSSWGETQSPKVWSAFAHFRFFILKQSLVHKTQPEYHH